MRQHVHRGGHLHFAMLVGTQQEIKTGVQAQRGLQTTVGSTVGLKLLNSLRTLLDQTLNHSCVLRDLWGPCECLQHLIFGHPQIHIFHVLL